MFLRSLASKPLSYDLMTRVAIAAIAMLVSRTACPQQVANRAAAVAPEHAAQIKEGMTLFGDHVRGILLEHCLDCHGGKSTKADFDLSTRESLLASGFVGETADESHMAAVIRHEAEPAMPFKADKLSDEAIQQISRWIDLGAPYDKPLIEKSSQNKGEMQVSEEDRDFWAFRRLHAIAPPDITGSDAETAPNLTSSPVRSAGIQNEIDRFLGHSRQKLNLQISVPADRRTLIRRASLDLLGLPPTPDEVNAFINDSSPLAYENLIEQLLQSNHYGERWARHWLDVARFAESTGFEHDYDRANAYHYRDFLIEAFNQDMPWNQMIRWQIAGDELAPDNVLALKATGFLAAGVFPTQLTEVEFESARYDELDDIVGTIGVAFLGLSTGCARCHDHKFDPIPTRDYYRLAATFASAIRSEKQVETHSEQFHARMALWEKRHEELQTELDEFEQHVISPEFAAWLAAPDGLSDVNSSAWNVIGNDTATSRGGATLTLQADGSWIATGTNPGQEEYTIEAKLQTGAAALRIEAFTHDSLPQRGPGRADNGNFALGHLSIESRSIASEATPPSSILISEARATHEQNQGGLSVRSSFDNDINATGWAVDAGGIGKDQAAVFVFAEPLTSDSHVTIRMRFHVNTKHSLGHFRLAVTNDPNAEFELGSGMPQVLADAIRLLQQGTRELSEAQSSALRDWYTHQQIGWKALNTELQQHLATRPQPEFQTILISSEGVPKMPHHADGRGYPHFYPDVHFLKRGDVKQKGDVAESGFLQVLLVDGAEAQFHPSAHIAGDAVSYRRAALANWLTDPQNGAGHLAARVIVNRLWQHHFGRGLVATPNDFGFQGARPTHPQLLDWLANDLIEGGWKLKRLHKQIMCSAAYRQAAAGDTDKSARDVENSLLWHYPARRLEAEAIRDSILAVSGVLDPTMYGPGTLNESMRRRSVYFSIKRSHPIPMMQVFDWPEHLVSIGQRSNTTIAPQALALMNSPQVRQYAEAFAGRIRPAADVSLPDAVTTAYQIAFSRPPNSSEMHSATVFIESQQRLYPSDADGIAAAVTDFCHALLTSNEFLYLP